MAPVLLDSAPVRAMRESADAFNEAVMGPPFFPSVHTEPLPAINRELLELLPDGLRESFEPFVGRSHDQAEYLIDPAARRRVRNWIERERSLPHRIIFGDRPFAPHATSGQGISWRCSTSVFLAEAATRIDAIDAAAVRREFSVAEMLELGLYKVHPQDDDDESFTTTLAELRRLGDYYHRLAEAEVDLVAFLY
jgi:hypothetical protein